VATEQVTQEEIQAILAELAKIRDPENAPTEQEVIDMIIRMKKRWGILAMGKSNP